ncbi:MAG: hypothetical protein ACQEP5_08375 [Actinomycetota bacterium]
MDALKEKRFLEDANSLKASVEKGNVLVPNKVQVRIVRIMQRYPSVSKYYDIATIPTEDGKRVTSIEVKKKENREGR